MIKIKVEIDGEIVREEQAYPGSVDCRTMHLKPWIRRNYGNKEYKIIIDKPIPKRIITAKEIDMAVDMRRMGKTYGQISMKLKISKSTISEKVRNVLMN